MPLPGGVPERPKGTGCKPVGSAYGGSNPPAPTPDPSPARLRRAMTTWVGSSSAERGWARARHVGRGDGRSKVSLRLHVVSGPRVGEQVALRKRVVGVD